MEDESNSIVILRLNRIESEIAELKSNDKEHSKNMTESEKSDIRTEEYIKQISKTLTSLEGTLAENKVTLAKSLEKSTQTEILAQNLKTTTDSQSLDLKDVKVKVTDLEELPKKNGEKTKWLLWSAIVGNGVGLIFIVVRYLFKLF